MARPVHSPRYVSACIISNFLRFFPGVQILTWSLFFPSYLIIYMSFLHPELHRNFPASFQLVLVRIVLHRVVCGYLTLPSWSSLPGIFHLFVPNQIYPFLQVWSYADYFFFSSKYKLLLPCKMIIYIIYSFYHVNLFCVHWYCWPAVTTNSCLSSLFQFFSDYLSNTLKKKMTLGNIHFENFIANIFLLSHTLMMIEWHKI